MKKKRSKWDRNGMPGSEWSDKIYADLARFIRSKGWDKRWKMDAGLLAAAAVDGISSGVRAIRFSKSVIRKLKSRMEDEP